MPTPATRIQAPLPTQPRPNEEPNVGQGERIACAVAGLLLAGFGVTRRNASTPILALLGGLLIRRGVTGQCEAYKRLGIDTTSVFID